MNTIKKITSIFVVFALFTNCYSYRKTENDPSKMVVNNKYHIALKNGKQMTTIVDSVSSNALYSNKKKEIPFDTIKIIEEGTYSKAKTVGLGVLVTLGAALTALIVIAIANFSINFGN